MWTIRGTAAAEPTLLRGLGRNAMGPSPVRLLTVPGLHDSGDGHWQTWLESQYEDAVRVKQTQWHQPDLVRWSERIAQTLASHDPRTRWVAVGHSFGCLALAHHLGLMQAVQRQQRARGHTAEASVRGGIVAVWVTSTPIRGMGRGHMRAATSSS